MRLRQLRDDHVVIAPEIDGPPVHRGVGLGDRPVGVGARHSSAGRIQRLQRAQNLRRGYVAAALVDELAADDGTIGLRVRGGGHGQDEHEQEKG